MDEQAALEATRGVAVAFLEHCFAGRMDAAIGLLAADASWWVIGDPAALLEVFVGSSFLGGGMSTHYALVHQGVTVVVLDAWVADVDAEKAVRLPAAKGSGPATP